MVIGVFAVAALFGPDLTLFGTTIVPGFSPFPADETDVINRLEGPSLGHISGTDSLGRDVLSRLIHGARPAMEIGIAATGLGIIFGTLIGMVSAYAGGLWDLVIQRVMDAFMALPALVLLLALVTILENSGISKVIIVIVALVFFIAPSTSRVIRGSVLSVKEIQYVEAARAIGAPAPRVLFRHLLPNITAPILVLASVTIGGTILAEATLSFLGLGANTPSSPTWGFMLNEAASRGQLDRFPWLAIAPGAAITLLVLAFNLLGDAIRDVLDPRLRGTGAN
jgi:peptide/nickel transport system permease protein